MFDHDSIASAAIRKVARIERPIDGGFMRKLQREAKQVRGWSARVTAQHLGITRATFKGMQTGKKTIGEMRQIYARNLHRELKRERAEQGRRDREVLAVTFAQGCDARMRALKISRKPRKCRECTSWFEPHNGRQRRCSECATKKRASANSCTNKKRKKKKRKRSDMQFIRASEKRGQDDDVFSTGCD